MENKPILYFLLMHIPSNNRLLTCKPATSVEPFLHGNKKPFVFIPLILLLCENRAKKVGLHEVYCDYTIKYTNAINVVMRCCFVNVIFAVYFNWEHFFSNYLINYFYSKRSRDT